uniref:Uncharacterized protein n=1 Tax=viral metagenome TaxID=1070528 RepID=A0A6C0C5T4_9ZZZZ
MNNSIVMDVILSLSLVFIYYIYTKIDKEVEVSKSRNMIALFVINMVILNIIKLLFSCNISPVDSKCSIPFHDKPPF